MGQSVDGVAEVISRLRFSSDEGAKYSGDLLAVMDILKNTTDLYKATRLRLSNADVEVKLIYSQQTCTYSKTKSRNTLSVMLLWPKIVCNYANFCIFWHLCLHLMMCRTTSRPSATYWRRNIVTNGKRHSWYVIRGCVHESIWAGEQISLSC